MTLDKHSCPLFKYFSKLCILINLFYWTNTLALDRSKNETDEILSVPVLYTRGTNYQVGYNVGKSFGQLIRDFLNELDFFNKDVIPFYHTPEGQRVYEKVLNICDSQFPQYIREIQGMADGAGLPFHKLFILHVEEFMTANKSSVTNPRDDLGCTDIMCNNNENGIIMGHTEDTYPECYGKTYIIQAEIVDDDGKVVEQFASVTYPGFLPGYTMGFNEHGVIHSVNTLSPAKRNPSGTPREFLARALLGKNTLEEVVEILKNPGYGISDGFNLNIHFANQSGPKVVYSIEVGPGLNGKKESELDILKVSGGDSYFHLNSYLRLSVEDARNKYSVSADRHKTLTSFPKAHTLKDVKFQLSDTSNSKWPVYRVAKGDDKGKTIMTGIFNTLDKSWYIYTGPAATTEPVTIIKMNY